MTTIELFACRNLLYRGVTQCAYIVFALNRILNAIFYCQNVYALIARTRSNCYLRKANLSEQVCAEMLKLMPIHTINSRNTTYIVYLLRFDRSYFH